MPGGMQGVNWPPRQRQSARSRRRHRPAELLQKPRPASRNSPPWPASHPLWLLCLQGLPVIRAFNAGHRFRAAFLSDLTDNGAWWFTFITMGESHMQAPAPAGTQQN